MKKYLVSIKDWGDVEAEGIDVEDAVENAVEAYYDQDPGDPYKLDVEADCEGNKFHVSADITVNFHARQITTSS